uniref:Uncharacterized protein n=1 Tax=Cannabis sativa TaxID=3483 RepID=A0A803Q850_CANSA
MEGLSKVSEIILSDRHVLEVSLGHGRDPGREISAPRHRLKREAATIVVEIKASNRHRCRTSHCTTLSTTMKNGKKEMQQLI